jgi:radical SAM protein with 4Fe4S-binding SPASM domain
LPSLFGNIKNYLKKIRSARRYASLNGTFDINQFRRIFIDPCFNSCNLRCPYCPVGLDLKLQDMSRGMLSVESLKEIWNKSLTNYKGKIGLYNWGESFLNPELPEIVRFIKEISKAQLTLNSNFSFSFDNRILEILKYLDDDIIIISCDGFSQLTCEKYRVNVDFNQVLHNVELIVNNKKSQTQLKWQYLKFPWNPDELESARKFCAERNITFYTDNGGITPDYPMLPSPFTFNSSKFRCEFFLDSLTINYDGEVYPCCAFYGPKKYSIGNAVENSLEEIFTKGKGRDMLDYLMLKSDGSPEIFCKHCIDRDSSELKNWKGDV